MPGPPAVRVSVPASSANLGPGFDALAVALDLPLSAWTVRRERRHVVTEGEGAGELPDGDSNLVWQALSAWCQRAAVAVPDVTLRIRSAIPLERGLGSSAAAAVAGATIARALVGGGGDGEVVDLAATLEGHPDNAAAAVYGGLVACAGGRVVRLGVTDLLRPIVCLPEGRQSTAVARGLLPDTVPLAAAAANGARTALVLAGLAGAVAWDPGAMVDAIHEPARLAAMPATGRLVGALRAAGVGACLSGAGPSVLAVVASGDERGLATVRDAAGDGWRVLPLAWDRSGAVVVRPPEPADVPRVR